MIRLPVALLLAVLSLTGRASAQNLVADPGKECASYGLDPNTEGYRACVSSLSGQDDARTVPRNPAADQQRAAIHAEMDLQRAQMRRDMDAETTRAQNPANGGSSNCVTTHNGTNTSTVCQ